MHNALTREKAQSLTRRNKEKMHPTTKHMTNIQKRTQKNTLTTTKNAPPNHPQHPAAPNTPPSHGYTITQTPQNNTPPNLSTEPPARGHRKPPPAQPKQPSKQRQTYIKQEVSLKNRKGTIIHKVTSPKELTPPYYHKTPNHTSAKNEHPQQKRTTPHQPKRSLINTPHHLLSRNTERTHSPPPDTQSKRAPISSNKTRPATYPTVTNPPLAQQPEKQKKHTKPLCARKPATKPKQHSPPPDKQKPPSNHPKPGKPPDGKQKLKHATTR